MHRRRIAVLLLGASLLLACGEGLPFVPKDGSNDADLGRAASATHVIIGSIDEHGSLSIDEQRSLDGLSADLVDATLTADAFDYGLETGRQYWLLVNVSLGGELIGDPGDIVLTYGHDPLTDEPVDGFPNATTDSGKTAVNVLDCLREIYPTADTRFDAFVAMLQAD